MTKMDPWCVSWFQRHAGQVSTVEWCEAASQPKGNFFYRDYIRTACAKVITLPVGIERHEPTCPECLKRIAKRSS